jgi:hypothetical protein
MTIFEFYREALITAPVISEMTWPEQWDFGRDCKDWSKEEIDSAIEETRQVIWNLEHRVRSFKKLLLRLRRGNAYKVKQRRSVLKLVKSKDD